MSARRKIRDHDSRSDWRGAISTVGGESWPAAGVWERPASWWDFDQCVRGEGGFLESGENSAAWDEDVGCGV